MGFGLGGDFDGEFGVYNGTFADAYQSYKGHIYYGDDPINGSTPLPLAGYFDYANSEGDGPKAYLNWLLFDEGFNLVDGGFNRMSKVEKETGNDVPHEKLEHDLYIAQPGYIYIYFSNEEETPVEVYFDDFRVEHVTVHVSQATVTTRSTVLMQMVDGTMCIHPPIQTSKLL